MEGYAREFLAAVRRAGIPPVELFDGSKKLTGPLGIRRRPIAVGWVAQCYREGDSDFRGGGGDSGQVGILLSTTGEWWIYHEQRLGGAKVTWDSVTLDHHSMASQVRDLPVSMVRELAKLGITP